MVTEEDCVDSNHSNSLFASCTSWNDLFRVLSFHSSTSITKPSPLDGKVMSPNVTIYRVSSSSTNPPSLTCSTRLKIRLDNLRVIPVWETNANTYLWHFAILDLNIQFFEQIFFLFFVPWWFVENANADWTSIWKQNKLVLHQIFPFLEHSVILFFSKK